MLSSHIGGYVHEYGIILLSTVGLGATQDQEGISLLRDGARVFL